ncbi:MAG: YiiD C-terminal domain-containing protein [Clostridiaceae bacterium]
MKDFGKNDTIKLSIDKFFKVGGSIMTECEFQEFLYEQIPITKAMELSVIEFSKSKVRVKASLKANRNHKNTAFGGSINSLMTVCGWSMVFINIKEIDPKSHIVIQKSNINYIAPIEEDFTAECEFINEDVKQEFISTYKKRGKSRLKLKVYCYKDKKILAEFEGQFVAYK